MISEIGSDCPLFIKNKSALASSRGELLKTIEIDLGGKIFEFNKAKMGNSYKRCICKNKTKKSE